MENHLSNNTNDVVVMEESSFWDKLRDNLAQGIKVAADRTDEIARTGKLKLDVLNLKRKLSHQFSELGRKLVVHINATGDKSKLGTVKKFIEQADVKEILDEVGSLRAKIEDIEKQLQEMAEKPEAKGKNADSPDEKPPDKDAKPKPPSEKTDS
jgi:nucleoside-triphosphatase THEP1